MLVLARRRGQRILVGDVVLVVLEVHRSSVKLGFEAPAGTEIVRAELVLGPDPPRPRRRRRGPKDGASGPTVARAVLRQR